MSKDPFPQEDNSVQSLALALGKATITVVAAAYGLVPAIIGITITEAIDKINKKLIENGQNILLKEMPEGRVDLSQHEKEAFIPIGYRYYRAAQEGTANRNLLLLAKLIGRQIDEHDLSYEKIVSFDNAIRGLSTREFIALSEICTQTNEKQRLTSGNPISTTPFGRTLMEKYAFHFKDLISTETTFSLLANKGWLFLAGLDDGIIGEGSSTRYQPTDLVYSIIDKISEIDLSDSNEETRT